MGNGAGTKACLVGENTPGNALLHADKEAANDTAGNSSGVKCTLEDGCKDSGNLIHLQRNQAHTQHNVQQRHHRHQLLGDPADTLDTADEDQRHDDTDEDADDQIAARSAVRRQQTVVDQRRIDGSGDGIDLGGIAGTEDGTNAEESIHVCQPHPLFTQTVLDVIHGAAHPVALGIALPVVDCQGHFRELGAHAQQSGNPHPEHGTRAADGNGARHAGDVAGTDSGRQSGTDRLERCQGTVSSFLLLEHTAHGILQSVAKFTDLQETGTHCQIQANTDDTGHCRNAPDKAVQGIVDICNNF